MLSLFYGPTLKSVHDYQKNHSFDCMDIYTGFPGSSAGKESACNAGGPGLIPGLGRSPGEGIGYPPQYSWASLVAQMAKNPPEMWETWVQSLGHKYPLEREMATHSSVLAWRIPTDRRAWPGVHGVAESDTSEWLSVCVCMHTHTHILVCFSKEP